MKGLDIPTNSYSTTPSHDTPQITINRDATLDLDSSNAFEGPEKLLEVWFASSVESIPAACNEHGLKSVAPEIWETMLDLVHCKVLSVVKSDHVDAYLLSESSMFVFPHKVILKTCGTTTLLYGLPRLLEIAAVEAGFPHPKADLTKAQAVAAVPYRIFYSRKNFLFPNRQHGPHKGWNYEVSYLDKLFRGGSAYMIGKMNGEHWYLYITEPHSSLSPVDTSNSPIDRNSLPETETKLLAHPLAMQESEEDETLEILMTDLDETLARQYYLEDAVAMASGQHSKAAQKARQNAVQNLGTLQSVAEDDGCDFDLDLDLNADLNGEGDGLQSEPSDRSNFSDENSAEGHAMGTVVSEICGLSNIYPVSKYPAALIDAYLFSPCGFSANGVIPAPTEISPTESGKSTHYFTVHVTPEPQCSFASFETNVPARQTGRKTADIVEQVVKIFKPGRFSVTMFETKRQADDDADGLVVAKKSKSMDLFQGYKRVERIVHDIDGYDLVFRYFERLDWKGGAPILGE